MSYIKNENINNTLLWIYTQNVVYSKSYVNKDKLSQSMLKFLVLKNPEKFHYDDSNYFDFDEKTLRQVFLKLPFKYKEDLFYHFSLQSLSLKRNYITYDELVHKILWRIYYDNNGYLDNDLTPSQLLGLYNTIENPAFTNSINMEFQYEHDLDKNDSINKSIKLINEFKFMIKKHKNFNKSASMILAKIKQNN